jgi:integrase
MLSFSAFFDPKFGFYRARFWSHSLGVDTERKVPEAFWQELGVKPPKKPLDRFDKLALNWAAKEAAALERTFAKAAGRQKLTWIEAEALQRKMNPSLVIEASLKQNERWGASIKKFLKESGAEGILPEEVDISLATRFRNWRISTVGYHDKKPRWKTVRNELGYLRNVCRFAFSWQKETGCEAVRLIALPPVDRDEPTGIALTEDEVASILDVADDETHDIIATGITTMLRKANLLGLRGEWFDHDAAWLKIDARHMKGRKAQKRPLSVPVARWAISSLRGRRKGLIFPNPQTGAPYDWLSARLTTLADTAGARPFSLHDLRTTGNSWLARYDVPLQVRKVLMHHASGSGFSEEGVTAIYTKVFVEQLREAVNVFDTLRNRRGW